MPWHPLVVLGVAAVLSAAEVRHPAIDGGPVLGQPRAAVLQTMAANGWTHETARGAPGTDRFGHAGIHLDVTVAFNKAGMARSARVQSLQDDTSAAFLDRHYPGLLAWLMGNQRLRVEKHFQGGELVGLDVGPQGAGGKPAVR